MTVGPHDVVAPSPSTPVRDGARITARYGRQLALTVNGKRRQVWVTARTVDEALDELGIRARGAFLSASRSRRVGREGLTLELRTPRRGVIVADGRRRAVKTTGATVRGALADAGVEVRRRDRVSADMRSLPRDGQVLRVVRVDVRKRTVTRALGYDTQARRTGQLFDGETRVERAGTPGRLRLNYRDTYSDRKRTERELVDRDVLARPVDKVVLVGTKQRPAPAATPSGAGAAPSADGLNWDALARCESGGNPRAVSPAGYYGLYQFSVDTWRAVGGSGYPHEASPGEQTARAQILYRRAGRGQWPVCGRHL